ncbi:MAG TPA: alpha/beta hydrolase-fold protein [Puia sp.]|nr:alpha/beta hydrolase-fold protein [Puia sp.]
MPGIPSTILYETLLLPSINLERDIRVDFYLPTSVADPSSMSLLLINDGQDMEKLGFLGMLEDFYSRDAISPLLCVGIHAGTERKMEYGTAKILDYKRRGAKAQRYTDFIFKELLPYISKTYRVQEFREKSFAGFSLGGLSALDIVWNYPSQFAKVGVFSGSLWWRTRDKNAKNYNDNTDRIMQQQIRNGGFYPWLRFFFECGAADEEEDRNNNGVIDSIDDTLDLITELHAKGYQDQDIRYLQLDDGKHDVATWSRAMPVFLRWGWGRDQAASLPK